VGFRGVTRHGRRFKAQISDGTQHGHTHLGTFDTAEEAALAFARARGPQEAKPAPLTAAEAVRQAAAEGLALERSDGAAGFRGVTRHKRRFKAEISDGSRGHTYLGTFDTPEEAALAFARAAHATEEDEEFEAVEVEGFTFRATAFVNAAADGTLHGDDALPAGKRQRLADAAALTPTEARRQTEAEGHAAAADFAATLLSGGPRRKRALCAARSQEHRHASRKRRRRAQRLR
jgi:hypothetical protein